MLSVRSSHGRISRAFLLDSSSFFLRLLHYSTTSSSDDIQPHFMVDYLTELAIVTSVVQLERQHLAQIAKQVQRLTGAKNVRIKTAIDESLVAGFMIRYGSSQSKMIDMSVKKQLEDIAK